MYVWNSDTVSSYKNYIRREAYVMGFPSSKGYLSFYVVYWANLE